MELGLREEAGALTVGILRGQYPTPDSLSIVRWSSGKWAKVSQLPTPRF